MKAVELRTRTNEDGSIRLEQTGLQGDIPVRVLLLTEENENSEEKLYLESITRNPAFDFLNEPEENVYSTKDGKPFKG